MKHPIDLSMLTPFEIKQIDENRTVLTKGKTSVALYMRFSSAAQSEQSIEGQLRDALAYCKKNDCKLAAVYVDRAVSGKDAEKRPSFQRMIADSAKKQWQYLLVWKLDRFARSRNDSAIYKTKLRLNGVRVVSVTENISENPEGIILEAVLEGMAEFYSAELSQKIVRGLRESALKCNVLGGHIPLGYKIEGKKFVIDPLTAPLVRDAFLKYAEGWMISSICKDFNDRGLLTSSGTQFNKNSFKSLLRNKRYIGVYKWGDIEIEDGMPAIIDRDLFERVQRKLKQNAGAPGKGRAKVDYLLSGKLFCGHCGQLMDGDCGTSHTGAVHYYYTCSSRKLRRGCDKKSIRKDLLERWVAEDALALLTDEKIGEIADIAVRQTEEEIAKHTRIPELTKKRAEVQTSINNLTKAIEQGILSDSVVSRMNDLESQKKTLDRELADEEQLVLRLDREQVVFWLNHFKGGNIEDEDFRRRLITMLVTSVTVWDTPDGDFRITTSFTLTSHPPLTTLASTRFGSGELQSIPLLISEPVVIGSICFITRIHSLR